MEHNQTDQPLVSVITPTYNSEKFVHKTIESVIKQTYGNWEMIIVDDASTDHTKDIIKKYLSSDTRITLISLEENKGAAFARNKAIDNSCGRFIAFLDSDDQWLPEKLEWQIKKMLETNVAFSYTGYVVVNENEEIIGEENIKSSMLSYKELLKHNDIGCLTVVLDKRQIGDIQMPDIRARQDYALWLELTKRGFQAHGIDLNLAKYRELQKSLSSKKIEMAKLNWKVYRDIEKLNFFKSLWYFMHFAINKTMKYFK
ncbi:glycosyltransferase family 2 protein [Salipaludibacillus agaradhaerens]|uniref:glycosyltransferase family 2 protein n=1 Tax=Salipaludibacillus agaradhaerens TaxID=76935 RepID=UPI0009982FAF|nr:glycosyltransferase family 2 protein [Salipaludibacillus agaradhaerens]